ncbi:hypothetical protein QQ045_025419 [Rhodiola kirilowii]
MGNCIIKHCSQSRAGKQDAEAEYFKEEKKSKACESVGGRVVRVKVVVTRKELEKFLRHNNKQRTSEYIFDADVMIKLITVGGTTRHGDDEWKPNLETIPEES